MKTLRRALALLLFVLVSITALASCTPQDPPGGGDGGDNPPSNLTVYVRADAPAGGDGTEASPYADVQEAYDAAVVAINTGVADHVTVSLAEGTYLFSEELTVNGAAFSRRGSISFIGEKGQTGVTLTSEKTVAGADFTALGDGVYSYTFPASAKDADGNYPEFRDASLDGVRLTYPISEYGFFAVDSAYYANQNGLFSSDAYLYVKPSVFADLPTDSEGYFLKEENGTLVRATQELWFIAEWKLYALRVDRIDLAAETPYTDPKNGERNVPVHVIAEDWNAFMSSQYNSIGELTDSRYWVANDKNLLSENGTFYYDRTTGTVYVKTDKEMADAIFGYSTLERLVAIRNAENITFENIAFVGTTFNYVNDLGYISGQAGRSMRLVNGDFEGYLEIAAIYGKNVKNITVKGCSFDRMAYDAVYFHGAVDLVTVGDCRFVDIGGTAVRIGESSDLFTPAVHNRDITVHNNYMNNIASQYYLCPAICISSVMNLAITSNTIVDTSYSAVSVGYNWVSHKGYDDAYLYSPDFVKVKNADISHNYFQDYMTRMSDGGAIYVVGGNGAWSDDTVYNRITNNYAVATAKVGGERHDHIMPYYHDGGSSHWYDENNVLVLAPDARRPLSCVYYQTATGGPSFNNTANNIYIVGYQNDVFAGDSQVARFAKHLEKYPFIGWGVVDRNLNGIGKHAHRALSYRVTVNEETGAYNIVDTVNKSNEDHLQNIYLYASFDDVSAEAAETMETVYVSCGSTLEALPIGFGEMP